MLTTVTDGDLAPHSRGCGVFIQLNCRRKTPMVSNPWRARPWASPGCSALSHLCLGIFCVLGQQRQGLSYYWQRQVQYQGSEPLQRCSRILMSESLGAPPEKPEKWETFAKSECKGRVQESARKLFAGRYNTFWTLSTIHIGGWPREKKIWKWFKADMREVNY